jgi:hypothetical protein
MDPILPRPKRLRMGHPAEAHLQWMKLELEEWIDGLRQLEAVPSEILRLQYVYDEGVWRRKGVITKFEALVEFEDTGMLALNDFSWWDHDTPEARIERARRGRIFEREAQDGRPQMPERKREA